MRVLSLNCNNCGGPLAVSQSTRFVTCRFCGAQLAIVQEGGAAYTELRELVERTERLEQNVAELEARHALGGLDRDWRREMENAGAIDEWGEVSVPSKGAAILGSGLAVCLGVACAIAGCWTGHAFLIAAGVVSSVVGVVCGFALVERAQTYEALHGEYRLRRLRLVHQIAAVRRG